MTTIIERLRGEGDTGGIVVIALIVGALAAVVIGMIAFGGAFDSKPGDTNLTIETPAPASPAVPTPTPETQPTEAQPQPQPQPAPDPSPNP